MFSRIIPTVLHRYIIISSRHHYPPPLDSAFSLRYPWFHLSWRLQGSSGRKWGLEILVTGDPLAVGTGSRAMRSEYKSWISLWQAERTEPFLNLSLFPYMGIVIWKLSDSQAASQFCLSSHSRADMLVRPAGGSVSWPNSWLTALLSWAAGIRQLSIWMLKNSIRIKPILLILAAVSQQKTSFSSISYLSHKTVLFLTIGEVIYTA